jgi:predicted membrane protein
MQTQNRHSIIGIILVALGALLVINNFGFLDFNLSHVIFSWHTIFVIIGIIILSNSKSSIAGIIFLVIGLWGYLDYIFPWFTDFTFRDLWPILLIIIGLSLLFRKKNNKNHEWKKWQHENYKEYYKNAVDQKIYDNYKGHFEDAAEQKSSLDSIEENAIFTTTRKSILSQNFKGGSVSAIFGGITIDFSKAKLADGENHLEIASIFGGCKIFIPRDWKVIVNVTSVFGGIDDKRYINLDLPTSNGVLVIKGAVVFGGCEIFSI